MVRQCQIWTNIGVLPPQFFMVSRFAELRTMPPKWGKTGDLREVGRNMIEIILSHWATYLLLAWVAVIVVANVWPRRKLAGGPERGGFSPLRAGTERSPFGDRNQ